MLMLVFELWKLFVSNLKIRFQLYQISIVWRICHKFVSLTLFVDLNLPDGTLVFWR